MSDALTNSIKTNIWVKISLILVVMIILMIPVGHIQGLINERNEFGHVAKSEVAEKWARSQATGSLVLSVPVTRTITFKDDKGKIKTTTHKTSIHFLPDLVEMKVETNSFVRQRGLYRVPLYESNISLSGAFSRVSLESLGLRDTQVHWERVELGLGVKEVRGLKKVEVNWNEEPVKVQVGEMLSGVSENAVIANLSHDQGLKSKGHGRFQIHLTLKGSDSLEFYPFGDTTNVEMVANWGAPSFAGAYLPEHHEIENEKFQASWKILGLTRNLPKHWEGKKSLETPMADSRFGVRLHMPLQNYQLNTRAVKYSLLFVLLTFMTMFFIEVIYGLRFHPLHYTMTGAGLSLFYLLLLSISEHLGFSLAYAVAGLATVLTISLYVLGVTKVKKGALIVFSQLSLVYGFLYVLLQQEDYTLIFGATGLWVILAGLMYVTRKIDWFHLQIGESKTEVQS